MMVLVGVLVVLFIVAFFLLERASAQGSRSRHWGWYPAADGSRYDGSDRNGGGDFGGGDFGGGGDSGGGGG